MTIRAVEEVMSNTLKEKKGKRERKKEKKWDLLFFVGDGERDP